MELPENRGVLLYLLLVDLLYGIITEIIGLITKDRRSRDAAIAAAFFFVFLVVVIFGSFIVSNIIYHIKKKDKVRVRITLLLVQSVGAVLYFYGDNIVSLVTIYGDDLGCGDLCVLHNKVAAMIASGAVVLFFYEFPSCLHKIVALLDYSEEPNTGWFSATRMIGTYVKMDALYNIVVVVVANRNAFCNVFELATTVTFFIICVVIGTGLMFVYSIYTWKQLKNSDEAHREWIVFLVFVLLTIFFPIYLLGDNSRPLDCAFSCDLLANNQNQTLDNLSCSAVAYHSIRLSLHIVTLVVVSTISIVLFCCRHDTRGEKVI